MPYTCKEEVVFFYLFTHFNLQWISCQHHIIFWYHLLWCLYWFFCLAFGSVWFALSHHTQWVWFSGILPYLRGVVRQGAHAKWLHPPKVWWYHLFLPHLGVFYWYLTISHPTFHLVLHTCLWQASKYWLLLWGSYYTSRIRLFIFKFLY